MKKFKDFKQFGKSQGFRTQTDFRKHVENLRAERAANISSRVIDHPSFPERYRLQNAGLRKLLSILVPSITSSKHANWIFGINLDFDTIRYSRSSNCRPLEYCNISYYHVGNRIITKTQYRNKIARVTRDLPENWKTYLGTHPGLLSREIGKLRHGVLIRFDKNFVKTGIAVELADPFNPGKKYWEHGKNIADCLSERDRKISAANEQLVSKRVERKSRLIKRLVNNYRVVLSDSLDAGNCIAGTVNWAGLRGLIPVEDSWKADKILSANPTALNYLSLPYAEVKRRNPPRVVEYIARGLASL